MKKLFKVLATAAALAAVVPYKAKADENGGEVEGLLWKATWKLDPDYQSEPDVNITFGFNNPFEKMNKESHLFADELVVDYCCDETLVHDESCNCTENDAVTPADFADEDNCCCAEETEDTGCDCGGDCNCKE